MKANKSSSKYLFVILSILMIVLSAFVCSCCKNRGKSMLDPKRSIYYWRTTFNLSSDEKSFINEHKIGRIYLHLFDVIKKPEGPMPDATIIFEQNVPQDIDIVPVVFITNDVIGKGDSTICKTLAQRIVKRVGQMMELNNLKWNELQVDFDWTQSNQSIYFSMLSEMRSLLQKQDKGISATIRLHQLAMAAPPVDYGAMMVYNIGNFQDVHEENSILSIKNLKPYLTHLSSYSLPLATALPIYSWNLTFEADKFKGIAHGINLADTTKYYHVPDSKGMGDVYLVKRYHTADSSPITMMQPGLTLYPGYIIRHEECDAPLLKEVREMISNERSNALDEVILYSLDNINIKKYSNEEIEDFLGRN